MKKIFLLAVILITALGVNAQKKGADTLKIKLNNGRKIWIFRDKIGIQKDSLQKEKRKENFNHWRGFDIGICALTTAKNQFQIPSNEDIYNLNDFLNLKYNRSWYFSLNLFEKNIHIYKNYVNLVTGLGVEWDSYSFSNNVILNPNATTTNSSTIKIDTSSNITYIKDKLKAAYVKIPLLLEFNTNNVHAHKSFHLACGMEFAYKIDSWTKQKIEQDGYTTKLKIHDDYNLSVFKYGFVVRAGYGGFTLFANYSLSPLFDANKGPERELYPLSTGIAFTF